MTTETRVRSADKVELVPSALLPEGYVVPASRSIDPSTRMRELLDTEPFLFGPGVYDPQGAELAMYYGFKAVYFSGYSFAIGHLGTTDMDLYSGPEIADGARRTISALRKFQLTMAVGDPEKGIKPKHLEIPPVVVDMDGGYGNLFNVQRTTELYVTAGVAAGASGGPGAAEALRPHRWQGAHLRGRDDRQAAHGAGRRGRPRPL